MKFVYETGEYEIECNLETLKETNGVALVSFLGEAVHLQPQWLPTKNPRILGFKKIDSVKGKKVFKGKTLKEPEPKELTVSKVSRSVINTAVNAGQLVTTKIWVDFYSLLDNSKSAFEEELDLIIMGNLEWGRLKFQEYRPIEVRGNQIEVEVKFTVKNVKEWRAETKRAARLANKSTRGVSKKEAKKDK